MEVARIAVSSQTDPFFNYECHPDNVGLGEESEGIPVWDLDDGRAPGFRGQLHAIMINVDWPDDDNLYFKHYTGSVHANAANNNAGNGTLTNPFRAVADAANYAWDGSKINIHAGYYSGIVTFSKRVQVFPSYGKVNMGNNGRVTFSSPAKISLSNGGMIKIY